MEYLQLWEESQAENARLRVEMAGIRFDLSVSFISRWLGLGLTYLYLLS